MSHFIKNTNFVAADDPIVGLKLCLLNDYMLLTCYSSFSLEHLSRYLNRLSFVWGPCGFDIVESKTFKIGVKDVGTESNAGFFAE